MSFSCSGCFFCLFVLCELSSGVQINTHWLYIVFFSKNNHYRLKILIRIISLHSYIKHQRLNLDITLKTAFSKVQLPNLDLFYDKVLSTLWNVLSISVKGNRKWLYVHFYPIIKMKTAVSVIYTLIMKKVKTAAQFLMTSHVEC